MLGSSPIVGNNIGAKNPNSSERWTAKSAGWAGTTPFVSTERNFGRSERGRRGRRERDETRRGMIWPNVVGS